ncbi:related to Geranylgeranyl transferase type-2 subunit alpha [Hanseniaspora guilliermondii]|uniref:Geranylgeranyl transferase type-2 subunit alpha n=1 Tax=Hanseniaspora guilliermondii TaxID=56406 RepID=A0A1L0B6K8_9ASCO|nr:related to Geranylgeranyl transferase type-2 subunit alpha [Hanseniaspora guilliermondii]
MHGVKRINLTEELRAEKEKKEAIQVDRFRNLSSTIEKLKTGKDTNQDLLKSLSEQLTMNPDLTTSYNLRRSIIKDKGYIEDEWNQELNFTLQLLTSNPKSYPLWQHRSWILKQIDKDEYYQKELNLTYKLLSMDKRNFHGWSYRREILDILNERLSLTSIEDLYFKEWEYLTMMINSDISNYSAWHQRRTLLVYYIESTQLTKIPEGTLKKLITKECDYIYQAIFTDAEDQSVWNYMKWFVSDERVLSILGNEELNTAVDKYLEAMREINEDELEFSNKLNKWCTLMMLFLTENYSKEITKVEKIDLLESLKKSDPLRINRYQEMIDKIE